jgi:hypothetical protein
MPIKTSLVNKLQNFFKVDEKDKTKSRKSFENSLFVIIALFLLAGIFFLTSFGAKLFADCDTCGVGTATTVGITLIIFGLIFLASRKFKSAQNIWSYRILLLIFLILLLGLIFFSPEIYSEDAYGHYLFSKNAVDHPSLFLDQWNKPVFSFLTTLPYQFGLEAARILSILAGIATIILTVKIAGVMKISDKKTILLLSATVPFFWLLATAPMTEIFFALIIALFLYFLVKDKTVLAALMLSLLPFVRQEGFLFLGFFFIYWIIKKKWFAVPASLIFPIIFGLISFLVYGDFFWMIASNPYLGGNVYGYGRLLNYPIELSLIFGPVVYILLFVGLVDLIRRIKNCGKEKVLLVLFIIFGLFHVIIWSLGLFRSAGYARVFIGLFPIIILISAQAIDNIKKINRWLFLVIAFVCFVLATFGPAFHYVVFLSLSGLFSLFIFAYKQNSFLKRFDIKPLLIGAGFLVLIVFLHFPQDYSIEHKTVIEATTWLSSSEYVDYEIYADSPSAIFFLNKDWFNAVGETKTSVNAKKGSILIWDTHFSKRVISEEEFLEKTKLLKTFSSERVKINIGLVEQNLIKTN